MAHLIAFTQDVAFEACVDMWHTLARQFIIEHLKFSPPEEVIDILKRFLCRILTKEILEFLAQNIRAGNCGGFCGGRSPATSSIRPSSRC
jgi:hypothetical protein